MERDLQFWMFYNSDRIGQDFYIEEFGYGVCIPKYLFAETRQNNLLQIVFNGKAHVSVGKMKPFTVSKGEAFYLPANIPHWYESDKDFPTERAWISWSGEYSPSLEKNLNVQGNPYLIKIKDLNAVKKSFLSLKNSRDGTETSLLNVYSCFFRILSNCVKTSHRSDTYTSEQLLVNDITKYINENIPNVLTVKDIADRFGYHPSSLFRKFKNITGTSLKDYILHCKMSLAKSLICETDFPIDEIVMRCGYQNTAALNALFLRHSYTSLAKYVKEHRTPPSHKKQKVEADRNS